MNPVALAADRMREAQRSARDAVDWVEELTGIPGPSACRRAGHCWERDIAYVRVVYGRPACPVRCSRCGARGFHWLPDL